MKILVLQIARLGDILMTWPAMRALRRAHPDAEIHLMVRPRFEAASRGLSVVDRVIALPTARLLEPIAGENPDDATAIARTKDFLEGLRAEGYDEVFNLSYSPLSSWIAKSVSVEKTRARGYTRFDDGSLHLADGVASYFYAQVGPGRANRVHLTELFAAQMEVELSPEDWSTPGIRGTDFGLPASFIVVHPGASEQGKTVPPFLWGRAIRRFAALCPLTAVVLIGAESEAALANEIRANAGGVPLFDLTGRTSFEDLFGIVGRARMIAGGDSAPIHVASLTGTRCLNVSVGAVNFWETGPRSAGSAVLRVNGPEELSSETIARAMADLHDGGVPQGVALTAPGIPGFLRAGPADGDFAWELSRALYLEGDFPVCDDANFAMAVQRLREMNDVAIRQLETLPATSPALASLMDRADDVFQAVARAVPDAGVLVRWALTEKTRIAPGPSEDVGREMRRVHGQFGKILRLYDIEAAEGKGTGDGAL